MPYFLVFFIIKLMKKVFLLQLPIFLWKMYNVVWFLTKWFFFPLNFLHSNSWPIEILCRYILYIHMYIIKSSGYPKSAYDPGWRMIHSTPIPQTHPLSTSANWSLVEQLNWYPDTYFLCKWIDEACYTY